MAPLSVHKRAARDAQPEPGPLGPLGGERAQPRIRRDPASDDQGVEPAIAAGRDRLGREHVRHRLLEARRDIGHGYRLAAAPRGSRSSARRPSSGR